MNWRKIIFWFILVLLGLWLVTGVFSAETCEDGGRWHKDESSPFEYTAEAGLRIDKICVKAGTKLFNFTQGDPDDGCYDTSGIKTQTASVWNKVSSKECKDISHASFRTEEDPNYEPTPTPTLTPTPTPTPEVCEQKEWSCKACQESPADDICYDNFTGYCSESYGCGWESTCPEFKDGVAREAFVCQRTWVCKDTCEQDEPTPTPTPEPTPTDEPRDPDPVTPACPDGQVCYAACTMPLKSAIAIGGERLSPDTVRFNWFPSTDPHEKQILIYGPSEDNLPYSVFDIPSDAGYYDVNVYDMGHWFFRIATVDGACYAYSNIVDP